MKSGFINRKKEGLPKEKCLIEIVHYDLDEPNYRVCKWHPVTQEQIDQRMVGSGFLGTAVCVDGRIGWHAWEQNNSEFLYYRKINQQ